MAQEKPDQPALIVGHIIVGLVALWVTAQFVRSPAGRIAGLVAGVMLHDMLDAPVSQAVSEAGL